MNPYKAEFTLVGVSAILFHRWNCDAVEAKALKQKGSSGKKTDDLESYVHRCQNGNIAIPGNYVAQALVGAAKFRQDPRSPRKSAQDLFKAGVVPLTDLANTGKTEWDYVDRRRAVVQRAGITRHRPALHPGWKTSFEMLVTLPEYIPSEMLKEVLVSAGQFVGIGDFRPTFGRFTVLDFAVNSIS
jgi:hypothetical protein